MLWFPFPWDILRWIGLSYGSHSQPQDFSHIVCPAFWSSQRKNLDETSRVSCHFLGDTCAVLLTAYLGMTLAKWKLKNVRLFLLQHECLYSTSRYIKTFPKHQGLLPGPPISGVILSCHLEEAVHHRRGSGFGVAVGKRTWKISKALDGWTCSR